MILSLLLSDSECIVFQSPTLSVCSEESEIRGELARSRTVQYRSLLLLFLNPLYVFLVPFLIHWRKKKKKWEKEQVSEKKKKKIVFIIEFSKGGLSFIQRSQSALCASETTTEPVWTMEFIDLVCLLSSWKSPHHLDYFWLKQTCPNFYFLIGKRALKWRLVTT